MSLPLESPSPSCSEFPSEVLGIILSNLGKSDLLNARCICRSWNEESVRVLQKSRFTQTLSDTTIAGYTKFVKDTNASKLILPFHLKFTVDLHKSRYRHVIRVTLKTLTKYVDTLCRIFGSECVSGLTLTTNDRLCNNVSTFMELGLIQLFHLISPGLKELDLTGYKVHLKIDIPNVFLTYSNLTFPKLMKMTCVPYDNRSRRGPQHILSSTSAHNLIHIIQNSSSLVDLRIIHTSDDLKSWPLYFDKLRTLAVNIVPLPLGVLDKIRQCNSTPVLQELHCLNVGHPHIVGDDVLLHNLLSSVSTTLKTLLVQLNGMFQLPFSKFPRLPHLENLQLDNSASRFCGLGFINYEDINFNSTTLPALKTVHFPIGTIFTIHHTNPGGYFNNTDFNTEDYMDVSIEFPNVEKITIWMDCQNLSLKQYGNGAMKHLLKIFPNASRVCIVNGSHYYPTRQNNQHIVKHLLSQMIQSDWANQIHEIELNGFDQDYLGQVLNRLDYPPCIVLGNCDGESNLEETVKNAFQSIMGTMKLTLSKNELGNSIILQETNQYVSHKMTSIRKVRLEFEDTNVKTHETVALQPMPNLTALAKHFPQLQRIEISQDLFSQRNHDVRRGHIRNFMSAFPGVVVDVI